MRLQVIDPDLRFECTGCARCCRQPFRVIIDPQRAAALDRVDWGAEFPSLAGRQLYKKVRQGRGTVLELAKVEGSACVFLDVDGRCIIHKKLGFAAKPQMCQQFPYIAAPGGDADYVSANYGCKAIQEQRGPRVSDQAEEVRLTVPLTPGCVNGTREVLLTPEKAVPRPAARALLDLAAGFLDPSDGGSIVQRLAGALATLEKAAQIEPLRLLEAIHQGELATEPDAERCRPFDRPARAPMPSRFLFAATLFPDTLPPDSSDDMGFLRRMTLVPKLMALAKMSGVYASRLLSRNVCIDAVYDPAVCLPTEPQADALLGRYLRSRLWQQFPAGSLLPIFSGFHQHILDINAVIFFARVRAMDDGRGVLDLPAVQYGLSLVELHLANQTRLYTHVLKGWFAACLASAELAWASLRMIPCPAPLPAAT